MKIYKAEKHIANGRTVGVSRQLHRKPEPLHAHEFIEVVYILSGKAIQHVDAECYAVERGDIVFINYGSLHAFEPLEELELVNIYFMPELLGDAIITPENALALLSLTAFDEMRRDKSGGKLSFFGEERRALETIVLAMLREYTEQRPGAERVIENYLGILFTVMLRKTAMDGSATEADVWSTLTDYIDENLHERLTLSSLAQRCFYNPSYFSRVFKQHFGVSLSDYLRTRRIGQAMRLLVETDATVDEIVAQTGYADRSTFYHAFSKQTGTSPAEYRAKNKVK